MHFSFLLPKLLQIQHGGQPTLRTLLQDHLTGALEDIFIIFLSPAVSYDGFQFISFLVLTEVPFYNILPSFLIKLAVT